MFAFKCQDCGKAYELTLDNSFFAWAKRCPECLEKFLNVIRSTTDGEVESAYKVQI